MHRSTWRFACKESWRIMNSNQSSTLHFKGVIRYDSTLKMNIQVNCSMWGAEFTNTSDSDSFFSILSFDLLILTSHFILSSWASHFCFSFFFNVTLSPLWRICFFSPSTFLVFSLCIFFFLSSVFLSLPFSFSFVSFLISESY